MLSNQRVIVLSLLAAGTMLTPGEPRALDERFGEAFPIVHRYHDPNVGLLNAYLVETETSVVAIDAGFLIPQAEALRAMLEETGKPLAAILLTHDHADHYNGAAILAAGRSIPVIATPRADWVIRREDRAKEARYGRAFGAAYPEARIFPNRLLNDGEWIEVDGVRFTVHDLGVGESRSDAYWIVDGGGRRYVFLGDLVLNRVHAFFQTGQTREWLDNLERLEAELGPVDSVYPGHGEPGAAEMIDWQRRYIETYRETVRGLAGGQTSLSDSAKAELLVAMREFLPGGGLEFFVAMCADVVAAELALEDARRALGEMF